MLDIDRGDIRCTEEQKKKRLLRKELCSLEGEASALVLFRISFHFHILTMEERQQFLLPNPRGLGEVLSLQQEEVGGWGGVVGGALES